MHPLQASLAAMALGSTLLLQGCAAELDEDEAVLACEGGKCDGFDALHCHDGNVIRSSIPIFHHRAGSPRFSYAFKRFPSPFNPLATTVIVLNGGPGATLLDQQPSEVDAFGGFHTPVGAVTTSQFHVVYTDQRGSGCNQLPTGDFPDEALTTDELALDVLAIVRRLGLTNYIILGTSYGTVQATRIAFLAPRHGLPAPRAIVLEGAVGRSPPGGFDEYMADHDAEWQAVKARLPAGVAARLTADPLPLGFSARTWGALVQGSVLIGPMPFAPHPLETALAPLAGGDPVGLATLRSTLEFVEAQLEHPSLFPQVSEVVLCAEVFGAARSSSLEGGALVPSGPDRCLDRAIAFRPYDSAQFPVTTPIFYFQGDRDPAVPNRSARHHYDHQRLTSRAFVTVATAGHGPLSLNLRLLGCSAALWSAIDFMDPFAFAAAVTSCGPGVALEGKFPGQ